MSKGGSATLQATIPIAADMTVVTTGGMTADMTKAIVTMVIGDAMLGIGRRWFQLLWWGLPCIGPIKPTASPLSL